MTRWYRIFPQYPLLAENIGGSTPTIDSEAVSGILAFGGDDNPVMQGEYAIDLP